VEDLLADFHRTLKPGGYMIHQIGIDDHLQHYDPAESPKNYLRFSDRAWKLLFENDVQYFNRLQACDWIDRIGSAGFVLLERIAETADVGGFADRAGFQALSAGRPGLHHSDLGVPKTALGVPKTALNGGPRKAVPSWNDGVASAW
ncbi:MAG: hypothetical protein ACREX8_13590, partial [Gammaproteobacteria bacterium]